MILRFSIGLRNQSMSGFPYDAGTMAPDKRKTFAGLKRLSARPEIGEIEEGWESPGPKNPEASDFLDIPVMLCQTRLHHQTRLAD
jgi:hypothetical protein